MSDLHAQIRAEVERRRAIARAATPGPWARYGNLGYVVFAEGTYDDPDYEPPDVTHGSASEADAEHIALHDPADAIRRYEYALKVLDRHEPIRGREPGSVLQCDHCAGLCHSASGLNCESPDAPWPCAEIADLADSFGIAIESETS